MTPTTTAGRSETTAKRASVRPVSLDHFLNDSATFSVDRPKQTARFCFHVAVDEGPMKGSRIIHGIGASKQQAPTTATTSFPFERA